MVKWSVPARQDLRSTYDYITKDSKVYATKVSQEIVEKSEMLNKFPAIGRIVPEINNPNIRELFIYSYRLIYKISPWGIEVLVVIHGKRDFSSSDLEKIRK
ncbi:MAG: type II toxin-antitoxin system RelE/ParE family toxin [Candidatus Desantisbacteria bacterium]